MRGLRRTEKFKTDKPSNQNLKRKQRGMAELETGGQELRSACDTKQKNGERKRRKLSTGIGRDAWKQAKRKRKRRGRKEPKSTVRTAVRGKREEGKRKSRRLSSQNRAESGRKEAESEGKARKRSGREEAEKKGSTGGTAVGAKPGRMKGNEQEAEYEEPGKKAWETRPGRTGKDQRSVSGRVAPGKPL